MDKLSEGSALDEQNSQKQVTPNSDRNGNLNSDQCYVESSVKLIKKNTEVFSDSDSDSDKPLTSMVRSKDESNVVKNKQDMDSDSNDSVFKPKTNKLRIHNMSSDEDNTPETNGKLNGIQTSNVIQTSDSSDSYHDSDNNKIFKCQRKSRIKNMSSSDEEIQHNSTENKGNIEGSALKNSEQQLRMKNRRNNIDNKFKNLLSSRGKKSKVASDEETTIKNTKVQNGEDTMSKDSSDGSEDLEMKKIKQKIKDRNESMKSTLYDPDTSDEDENSRQNISQMVKKSTKTKQKRNDSSSNGSGDDEIQKIRQKIKKRSKTLKTTICDPDTSEEDNNHGPNTPKAKSVRKSTKMISPQPMRMSAKQAMENMQKIKSESNRMLREKEVSLPYHRPKALSLKDIMSRRKPALSSDGKALPIKMNDEQLRQYAQQLEQRQKEMMELCKSDTEDEETPDNDPNPSADLSTKNNDVADDRSPVDTLENVKNCNENDNDKSFDEVNLNLENNDVAHNKSPVGAVENVENCNETDNDQSFDEVNLNLIDKDKPESSNTNNDPTEIEDISKINKKLEINDAKDEDVLNNETSPAEKDHVIIENATNTLTTDETCHVQENADVQNNCDEATISEVSDMIIDAVALNTEVDSQLISLNYDSEKLESNNEIVKTTTKNIDEEVKTVETKEANISIENENGNNSNENQSDANKNSFYEDSDLFDNDDIDMEDIDRLIENAEIINTTNGQAVNSPMLMREPPNLNSKPKLAGAPGMVIDLDGTDAAQPKKLSGVELLKERFSYFAKLKTPEEIERIREKKIKPGTQHSKLKQELEEQMAEQRSLEWAKRLEEDKQQQQELSALRGDESEEDDIEKIEAKLAETEADIEGDESSSESEEEPEENDVIIKDKPIPKNALVCDEAEESDCDEGTGNELAANDDDEDIENNDDSDEEQSSEESSEDENENAGAKSRKGRILKAFEDSDEEERSIVTNDEGMTVSKENTDQENDMNLDNVKVTVTQTTQDDELPSAQLQKSFSEDLFASQGTDAQLTNSIEKPNKNQVETIQDRHYNEENMSDGNNLAVISETQPYDDAKFDDIVGMCSGSFSQNIVNTQPQATQPMQTQELGDDVLALCTGKFYDNEFITQEDDAKTEVQIQPPDTKECTEKGQSKIIEESPKDDSKTSDERNLLKSLIDELDGPEFHEPKPNKFFPGNSIKEIQHNTVNNQKKRFVIDSDEEERDPTQVDRKKKQKRKKLQDRALQISDDEEENIEEENEYEDMSELEEEVERVVEYDSEENEVEIQQPVQNKKKKRKVNEFFENEAELTSEDEYVGSGDEDERGLDRMEREEGDDDTFHQGRLQAELGQIHMRDVLDQDKREVRLIQELLFEDGDLGDGHRQRKFRWRNADGVEETGSALDEFGDTQEEEFESEEQWRKQRHEREVFLRTMMQKETDESDTAVDVSINRTAIIKANLTSKTMSSLLMEVSSTEDKSCEDKDKFSTDKEKSDSPLALEKKSSKDIPSPVKKPFSMMQQNYRGSILSRGSGALARLAALATPLAGDNNDNTPKIGSLAPRKQKFVFAAVSPKTEDKPKVSKRKGDINAGTPQLMKKMKTDEKRGLVKTSLLDHLRV